MFGLPLHRLKKKWHMIIILLDIKDGDVWCMCVRVSRWLLGWWPRLRHTLTITKAKIYEAFRESHKRREKKLHLSVFYRCSLKPISYWSSLLNTQHNNWHNLSCKCLFGFFFKEKKTWILKVILDAIPFWWVKWSSGVILISKKKEKQLSRVSYSHTCCHCYNYWFITQSCPKSFYDQFYCATKGVQSVIYIVVHYEECLMKLGAI